MLTFSKSAISSLVVTRPISFSPTFSGIALVITYKKIIEIFKDTSANNKTPCK
jgi:hypothetical protein